MNVEEIKKLNIYGKLSLIENEIGVVEKGLSVSMGRGSYKAVSERDVLDAVKPIEQKYRVYSYPFNTEIIKDETLGKTNNYGTSTSQFLRLKRVYRFVNIDKPDEYIDVISYGDGIDTGDKAPGKAMTYADKYALMKAYKLSTGDDPDKEASPQEGYRRTYQQQPQQQARPQQSQKTPITVSQKQTLENLYNHDELMKILNKNGINSVDQLNSEQAIYIIKRKLNKQNRETEMEGELYNG